MYYYDSNSKSPSVRTNYSHRKNRINRIQTPASNKRINFDLNENNNTNNYNNNNNYYYSKNNEYETNKRKANVNKGNWSEMLSRTSKEGGDQINSNPKNFENDVLARNHYHYDGEKKHFKESSNYDYTTKTQITTLPGGVKRNKYEIKDDMYFRKPYNESRLYKMVRDYNCNINYEKDYDPITQGYNVNTFPIYQRFYGSYKRGMKDHDIFNSKTQKENNDSYNYRFYRK